MVAINPQTRNGFSMDIKLEGGYALMHGLGKVQPGEKNKLVPEMYEITKDIVIGANSRVDVSHPHGLWRVHGTHDSRMRPGYSITRPGIYWLRIQTPPTPVGKSEAMAEFMSVGYKPQGVALASALTSVYGRNGGPGNGRILWAVRDDMDAEIGERLQAALDKAAAEIQKGVDTVG